MRGSERSSDHAGHAELDAGLEALRDSDLTNEAPPAMFVRRVRRRRWARRAKLAAPAAMLLVLVGWAVWPGRARDGVDGLTPHRGEQITRSPAEPRPNARDAVTPPEIPAIVTYATLLAVNRTRSGESLWLGTSEGAGAIEVLTPADVRNDSAWKP